MVSSTSEMMYWILKQMKINPKDRLYNNFLLTGISLDTNKGFMTPLKNNYDDFNNIIVIDHHKTDDNTIKTKNKFILPDMVSSTSEMMYWILKQM